MDKEIVKRFRLQLDAAYPCIASDGVVWNFIFYNYNQRTEGIHEQIIGQGQEYWDNMATLLMLILCAEGEQL